MDNPEGRLPSFNNLASNLGTQVNNVEGNYTQNYTVSLDSKIAPSLIGLLINELSRIAEEDAAIEFPKDWIAFKAEDKLSYNNVIKYRELINDYAMFYDICDNILNINDNSNPGAKSKLLNSIRDHYKMCKGELIRQHNASTETGQDLIKQYADVLIDKIIEKCRASIIDSTNLNNVTIEDMNRGLNCIICYCFIKCKILEKPNDN